MKRRELAQILRFSSSRAALRAVPYCVLRYVFDELFGHDSSQHYLS